MVIIFIYLLDFQFNNNNGVDELKFGQFIFRFMIFFIKIQLKLLK